MRLIRNKESERDREREGETSQRLRRKFFCGPQSPRRPVLGEQRRKRRRSGRSGLEICLRAEGSEGWNPWKTWMVINGTSFREWIFIPPRSFVLDRTPNLTEVTCNARSQPRQKVMWNKDMEQTETLATRLTNDNLSLSNTRKSILNSQNSLKPITSRLANAPSLAFPAPADKTTYHILQLSSNVP